MPVNFAEWEPVYEAILEDFGFDRRADERARDVLATLVNGFDHDRLDALEGAAVAIAGAGPSLESEVERVAGAGLVIAASTAAHRLRDLGVSVDLMVTDLDKTPGTARDLAREGVPVAVHAHGDNASVLEREIPRFDREHVLATTQAAPAGPVRNFGGFTDGDRAAFLADHAGAESLVFGGWDFDDPTVDPEKRRKLVWAERLLYWLERRRDERFAILDGRRASIDTGSIPVE